jgi:hypothetical protein
MHDRTDSVGQAVPQALTLFLVNIQDLVDHQMPPQPVNKRCC